MTPTVVYHVAVLSGDREFWIWGPTLNEPEHAERYIAAMSPAIAGWRIVELRAGADGDLHVEVREKAPNGMVGICRAVIKGVKS